MRTIRMPVVVGMAPSVFHLMRCRQNHLWTIADRMTLCGRLWLGRYNRIDDPDPLPLCRMCERRMGAE